MSTGSKRSCPERLEYIASVENRSNRFFKFSLNFEKVGTIFQITTKTNSFSKGTFIDYYLEITLGLNQRYTRRLGFPDK